jgi:hypothetical protein
LPDAKLLYLVLSPTDIGAMQWAVSIRKLDIAMALMSLSSFHAMPRRGHLERAKQIYVVIYER